MHITLTRFETGGPAAGEVVVDGYCTLHLGVWTPALTMRNTKAVADDRRRVQLELALSPTDDGAVERVEFEGSVGKTEQTQCPVDTC